MIRTFATKSLKALWQRGRVKGIGAKDAERIVEILDALDKATKPEDMDLLGFDFHALKGDRRGEYAVTIRANHRIIFRWDDGDVVRVEKVDYHGE